MPQNVRYVPLSTSAGAPIALAFSLIFWLFLLFLESSSGLVGAEPKAEYQQSGGEQGGSGGFLQFEGTHILLTTDLPSSPEIEELPKLFDAAMPLWCEIFGVPAEKVASWKVRGFLIDDRQRFQAANMIPKSIPNFLNGYQQGDALWLLEQPSAYYRRHLLLHEGTHWFMQMAFGGAGPPWYMEGVADQVATHRWIAGQLQLGIIPENREEVPFWGRLRLIHETLAKGTAPSLEAILRYDQRAHLNVEAYAWSWAAVVFLKNHPDTAATFEQLHKNGLDNSDRLTLQMQAALKSKWPVISASWNAFVLDLDFGFDPTIGMITFAGKRSPLKDPIDKTLDVQRAWQDTGILLKKGDTLRVTCTGEFTLADEPVRWPCQPQGITLEYHQGFPMGRVLGLVASPTLGQSKLTKKLPIHSIGKDLVITAPNDGILLLKINEPVSRLGDNTGSVEVHIERVKD